MESNNTVVVRSEYVMFLEQYLRYNLLKASLTLVLSLISYAELSMWLSCLTFFTSKKESNHLTAAKSLQLCPTLCHPRDGSPLGSSAPGILQARILEWVAISFSNAWKWKVKVKSLSRVRLLVTSWTAAYQAPPSMGFSRLEYWSGVPLPSPNHLTRFL